MLLGAITPLPPLVLPQIWHHHFIVGVNVMVSCGIQTSEVGRTMDRGKICLVQPLTPFTFILRNLLCTCLRFEVGFDKSQPEPLSDQMCVCVYISEQSKHYYCVCLCRPWLYLWGHQIGRVPF